MHLLNLVMIISTKKSNNMLISRLLFDILYCDDLTDQPSVGDIEITVHELWVQNP